MMITFRRMFMAAAAFVAVSMQGCGCDDNDDRYYTPSPGEPSVNVEGTATKGVLRRFLVEAFEIDANGGLSAQPVHSSITNDSGSYRLSIPRDRLGNPFVIRVTPQTGSTMLCDMELGCDGAAFGDPITVPDDFELQAVLPSVSQNTFANITLFSHLAARYALDNIQGSGLDAIRAAIASANSRVANRFGIVGDLTAIPVINLTDANAVLAAAQQARFDALRLSALNSAFIPATISRDATHDFSSAFSAFVSQYLARGFAGNTADEFAQDPSFADFLQYASRILGIVQSQLGENGQDLAGLIQDLQTEAELAAAEEPNQFDQGTPSDTVGATPRAKAVAMVTDLRNLLYSFGEVTVEGGTLGGIAEDFALQVEAAELAASEDLGLLVNAMALAASAVDDANRAYEANNTLTSYASDNGIVVDISSEAGAPVYEVDETVDVDGTDVDVTLVARNAVESTPGEGDIPASVDGRYDVSGSATIPSLTLAVGEGSRIEVDEYASTVEGDAEAHALAGLDLNLQVAISQQGVSDAVSLNGNLVVSVENAALDEETTVGQNGETQVTEFTVGVVSFKFSGAISNTSGEAANFALALSGDGTGVSLVETWVNGTDSLQSETENNFADLHGSLLFTAKLTGNPNVVVMNFGMTRTGLESSDNTLSIKYPGKQFNFSLAVEDGEPEGYLTVVNQDGVRLRIREGATAVEGDVTYDGTVHGFIEERAGNVVVRFPSADGDQLETLY